MTTVKPTRGRFITLEGGEGVGKSTQAQALAAALREHGLDVVVTREPGGSKGAERIRELLLHGVADAWDARAEALLFAAARSDHVSRTIAPALARGAWVVCDRFVDSSRAYQGDGNALGDGDIVALHRIGSGGLMPDRTLLLELGGDVAIQRRVARASGDRFEHRSASYHAGVAARFRAIAEAEPERVRTVAADASESEVTRRLIAALADLL